MSYNKEERPRGLSSYILKLFSRAFCLFFLSKLRIYQHFEEIAKIDQKDFEEEDGKCVSDFVKLVGKSAMEH